MLSRRDRFVAFLFGAFCLLTLVLLLAAVCGFGLSSLGLLRPLASRALLQLLCLFLCAFLLAFLLSFTLSLFFTTVPGKTKFRFFLRASLDFLASLPPAMLGLLGYLCFASLAALPGSHAVCLTLVFVMFLLMENRIEAALRAVPESCKEASKSLGASPLATTLYITIPQAAKGILSGTTLAAVRALGEAVVFVLLASVH